MASADATLFLENLKLWDRPLADLRHRAVLRIEDNVDAIVDEMFERCMDLEIERRHARVGNC